MIDPFDLVALGLKNRNEFSMACSAAVRWMVWMTILRASLLALRFGLFNDLLLDGGPGMGFLFQAFNQLCFGFFGRQSGNFFPNGGYVLPGAFSSSVRLILNHLDLPVQGFFDGFVFL